MKFKYELKQHLIRTNFKEFTLIPTIHISRVRTGITSLFPTCEVKFIIFFVSLTLTWYRE